MRHPLRLRVTFPAGGIIRRRMIAVLASSESVHKAAVYGVADPPTTVRTACQGRPNGAANLTADTTGRA
jgi:hypothetical protein